MVIAADRQFVGGACDRDSAGEKSRSCQLRSVMHQRDSVRYCTTASQSRKASLSEIPQTGPPARYLKHIFLVNYDNITGIFNT